MLANSPPDLEPPRFDYATTSDGVRISYAVYPGRLPMFLSISTPGAPPLELRAPTQGGEFARMRRERAGAFFDWRGAGLSDQATNPISMDGLIADLEAVTAALGEPVDAIVWGRSCFPVCLHAAAAPQRYRSIRFDSGALRPGENWQGLYNRPGWEPFYSEHLQGLARHYFGATPEEAMTLATRWEQGVPGSLFAAYLEAESGIDLTEVLPRIDVPTWVTARNSVDYEPAAMIAALLPQSTLSIYQLGGPAPFGGFGREEWDRHVGARLGDPPSFPLPEPTIPADEIADTGISEREYQVLALVASGDTNRQIGTTLGITEGTVKRHVSHLLQKTGLTNRRQLMRFADEHSPAEPLDPPRDDR